MVNELKMINRRYLNGDSSNCDVSVSLDWIAFLKDMSIYKGEILKMAGSINTGVTSIFNTALWG